MPNVHYTHTRINYCEAIPSSRSRRQWDLITLELRFVAKGLMEMKMATGAPERCTARLTVDTAGYPHVLLKA